MVSINEYHNAHLAHIIQVLLEYVFAFYLSGSKSPQRHAPHKLGHFDNHFSSALVADTLLNNEPLGTKRSDINSIQELSGTNKRDHAVLCTRER
jgi:hypothetical protein